MLRNHYLLLSLSLAFLVVAVVCFLQWTRAETWKGADLYQHYAAGHMVREGKMPLLYRDSHLLRRIKPDREPEYTFNYVYSPLVARLMGWVAPERYLNFYTAWVLLSLGLLGAAIWALNQCIRVKFLPFYVLGFPSAAFSLILGQNTPLSLLIISVTGFLLKQSRPIVAGLVLSCLFYKPQLLPFLFFVFWVMGWHRVNLGLICGGLFWLALTIIIGGWEHFLAWAQVLAGMGAGTGGGQSQNWTLNVTWLGFFRSFGWQPLLPLMIVTPLVLVFIGGWLRLSKIKAPEAFFLAVAACLPFLPYALSYELLLTAPAFLLLASRESLAKDVEKKRMGWNAVIALLWWLVALFSFQPFNSALAVYAPVVTFVALWTMGSFGRKLASP